ncbi:unnamed protein product [Dovyalis caffra]|uniref:Uncharacterized protein n=1 Tax=Dovyalis caffra TaxID=77055 RepID=A0AAV1RT46_9ROSI|nr:unnamed protein product [Dovyalis caffra]
MIGGAHNATRDNATEWSIIDGSTPPPSSSSLHESFSVQSFHHLPRQRDGEPTMP